MEEAKEGLAPSEEPQVKRPKPEEEAGARIMLASPELPDLKLPGGMELPHVAAEAGVTCQSVNSLLSQSKDDC
jgi:hypothetical protein